MTSSASGTGPELNQDVLDDMIAELVPELGDETESPRRPGKPKKPRPPGSRRRPPLRLIGIVIGALLALCAIGAAIYLLFLNDRQAPDELFPANPNPEQPAPFLLPTPTPEPQPQTLPADRSVENAVLQAVNELRQQHGLNSLALDQQQMDAAYGASLQSCYARQRDRWDLGPHTRHTLAGGIQYIRQLQLPAACHPDTEPGGQPLTAQAADAVRLMSEQPAQRAVLLQTEWRTVGVSLATDGFRLSVSLRLAARHVAWFEQPPQITEAGILTLDVRLNDTAFFPIQGVSPTLPATVYYQPPPSAPLPYGAATSPDCYGHGIRIVELRRRPEAIPANVPIPPISQDLDNPLCDGNIATRPMDIIVPQRLEIAPDRMSLTADLSGVTRRHGPGIYTVLIGGAATTLPTIAAYAIPYRVRLNPTAVAAYRPPEPAVATPSPTPPPATATAIPTLPPLPTIPTTPTATPTPAPTTAPTQEPPTPTPAPPTPTPTPPLTPQNARTVTDWLTLIGKQYPDYARRLTQMSFHRGSSPEALAALRAIYHAGATDTHSIRWIFEQPAVQDGINRREAVWVATMPDFLIHQRNYELATRIINTRADRHEQDEFTTPAGQPVKVHIARRSDAGHNLMRQIRQTINQVEAYMGEPFPASTVTVIYAEIGIESARAYWTPTHLVLPPEFDSHSAHNVTDRFSTTSHEIAHFYWHSSADWLDEGAAELISAAARATAHNQPISRIGYSRHQPCEQHDTIAELIADETEPDGGCAYFLGERFFQTLMRNTDPEDFRQGMRRLYRLTQDSAETREPIALVRQAFGDHRTGLNIALRIWYQGDDVIDDRPRGFHKPSDLPAEPGSYRLAGCLLRGSHSLLLSDDCRFHQDGMVLVERTYRQNQEQELTPGRFYLLNVVRDAPYDSPSRVASDDSQSDEIRYCQQYPYRTGGPACDPASMMLPVYNLDSSDQTLQTRGWLSPVQPMTVNDLEAEPGG